MPEQDARYLVKLHFEDKARPVMRLATVEHPKNCVWLQLIQCSGDVLLVNRDQVDYVLDKAKQTLGHD